MGSVPVPTSGSLLESPGSSTSSKSDPAATNVAKQLSSGGLVPASSPYNTHFPHEGDVPLITSHYHHHQQLIPNSTTAASATHLATKPMLLQRVGPSTSQFAPSPTPSKKKSITGTLGRIFKRGVKDQPQIGLPQSPIIHHQQRIASSSPSLGIAFNPQAAVHVQQKQLLQQQHQQQQHLQFLRHKEMQQQHLYQLTQQRQQQPRGEKNTPYGRHNMLT